MDYLSINKLTLTLIFLAYASYQDLRYRKVSNLDFIIFTLVMLYVLQIEYLIFGIDVLLTVKVVFVTFVLSFILFSFGWWGGADGKMLMFIALAYPTLVFYVLVYSILIAGFFMFFELIYLKLKREPILIDRYYSFIPFIFSGFVVCVINCLTNYSYLY